MLPDFDELIKRATALVTECELLKKQLTEKDTVISNNQLELTKVREELAKASAEAIDYKAKYEKADELRAKWLEAYKQSEENYSTCKTDRATFQKQLTECKNEMANLTYGWLFTRIWEKIRRVKI